MIEDGYLVDSSGTIFTKKYEAEVENEKFINLLEKNELIPGDYTFIATYYKYGIRIMNNKEVVNLFTISDNGDIFKFE
jgi:hypothetical protein